jgi:hypothetical protein
MSRHRHGLTSKHYLSKWAKSSLIAFIIMSVSLLLGVFGYHVWGGLPWLDSLLNASMILSGMGPVDTIHTEAGKWFASFYALYSGVTFLTSFAIFVSPLVHHFLHHFHLDEKND